MKLLWRILKTMGMVTGLLAGFGSLIADAMNVNIWGLAWQYWAMIGFTVFGLSLAVVIWQQHSTIKRLTSDDTELERELKRKQIEALEARMPESVIIPEPKTQDTPQTQEKLEGNNEEKD